MADDEGRLGRLAGKAREAAAKAGEAAKAAAEERASDRAADASASEERGPMPAAGDHYDAVVNKGNLSVRMLGPTLNKRWKDGWQLSHIFEQKGNTVLIYERRPGM